MQIDPALQQQFQNEGYCVLDRVFSADDLAVLDTACQELFDQQKALMELVQTEVLGLSRKDKRYFLACQHAEDSAMRRLLTGDLMAGIVGGLLGPEAFLFMELFIIKAARTGMPFGWHQDSGYLMGRPHAPYLALWCALDDVTEENGALQVLPYSRLGGSREVRPHVKDRPTGDFIGYNGDDPGLTLPVERGSIVALSSLVFHRSGPNSTDAPRRAFLGSYSVEPVLNEKGELWNHAVPFLQGGVRVGRG